MHELSLTKILDRIAFPFVAITIGVVTFVFALRNVPNPNVTWDEAGQYWMTQGQAFANDWGTPPGSLWTGLDLGRHGNILDPVGFTILLKTWIAGLGSDPSILRSLPFIFFVGTLLVSFWMGWRLMGLPRTIALLIPSAVLTTYVSMQWATEIRPYSIELFGVIVAAAGALAYLRSPDWYRMVGLSLALSGFCIASRYSFALAAGTAMTVVLLILWRSGRLMAHWREVLFGYIVLTLTALFLVWNLGFLDSGDQVWDNYGDPIRMESITDFSSARILIQVNFLYGWHKLTAGFILLGSIILLVSYWLKRTRRHTNLVAVLKDKGGYWIPAWSFVVIYELACAASSQIGWAQWNSEFRHSIGLIGAAIISGLGLAVLAAVLFKTLMSSNFANSHLRSILLQATLLFLAILVLVSLMAVTISSYVNFRRTNIETLGETVPTRVSSSLAGETDVRWLIDTQLWPSLRYLVEASGVYLGSLDMSDAKAFGSYGHNSEILQRRLLDVNTCQPGVATAVLVANSVDQNFQAYENLRIDVESRGCAALIIPLSDTESMVLIK